MSSLLRTRRKLPNWCWHLHLLFEKKWKCHFETALAGSLSHLFAWAGCLETLGIAFLMWCRFSLCSLLASSFERSRISPARRTSTWRQSERESCCWLLARFDALKIWRHHRDFLTTPSSHMTVARATIPTSPRHNTGLKLFLTECVWWKAENWPTDFKSTKPSERKEDNFRLRANQKLLVVSHRFLPQSHRAQKACLWKSLTIHTKYSEPCLMLPTLSCDGSFCAI